MSENYKPGDIAIITDRAGAEEIGICTTGGSVTGRVDAARWRVLSGGEVWSSVTAARRLVVLDPHPPGCAGDKALRVENVVRTLRLAEFIVCHEWADQIEAQTRPPKPAEPTALGAVVKDAGKSWVHFGNGCWIQETPNACLRVQSWSDFSDDVEVDR